MSVPTNTASVGNSCVTSSDQLPLSMICVQSGAFYGWTTEPSSFLGCDNHEGGHKMGRFCKGTTTVASKSMPLLHSPISISALYFYFSCLFVIAFARVGAPGSEPPLAVCSPPSLYCDLPGVWSGTWRGPELITSQKWKI